MQNLPCLCCCLQGVKQNESFAKSRSSSGMMQLLSAVLSSAKKQASKKQKDKPPLGQGCILLIARTLSQHIWSPALPIQYHVNCGWACVLTHYNQVEPVGLEVQGHPQTHRVQGHPGMHAILSWQQNKNANIYYTMQCLLCSSVLSGSSYQRIVELWKVVMVPHPLPHSSSVQLGWGRGKHCQLWAVLDGCW